MTVILSSPRYLLAFDNEFTGPIPRDLPPRLAALQLQANKLTGTIPPSLGALPRLAVLKLEGNALTGVLPPELTYPRGPLHQDSVISRYLNHACAMIVYKLRL